MTRVKRVSGRNVTSDRSVRLRVAWMYYDRKMTQKEIADTLGLARTTVIRLLEEVLHRGEVQIWIATDSDESPGLAADLENRLGLAEAIVVPDTRSQEEANHSVGTALGRFLSETMQDGMTIGVGWGRTLNASLSSFRPARLPDTRVISLLGGMIETGRENTTDYAWQLASRMGAECFLYPAPLLVDSPETANVLRKACGLDRLDRMATSLDMAVLSVGDIGETATSLSRNLISSLDYTALVAQGAVCDVMCHALDGRGTEVDHPLNRRIMSVALSVLAETRQLVLASGGRARAPAILAAIKRLGCHTLITDEGAAHALLDLTADTP
ncbi:sugar-binding transcriptional regulator [Asaia prunellae]|uniref:sugar-binding transcriptional regulator n=1 Tax=Asaia prunellae TaxID=610245 RepID=UPI000472D535|nr:sugar-binding domain-containing protein [Asaia prunellae]